MMQFVIERIYYRHFIILILGLRSALCKHLIMSENQFQQKAGGGAMDATVQVRQRGSLTLPASFRERYKIKPGDTFKIIDLDGIFLLMPMTPMVPELAHEIEHARVDAGFSIEEMLASLRDQRERYVREKYDQLRQ
jgi:bifunctional DNA-binding transcriptional regulator/antitoxin component of YhaV-PrlF toxin-antitoxin module